MKRTLVFLLIILSVLPVFAGNKYYRDGDTDFAIRLGSNLPVLISFPNVKENYKGMGLDDGKTGLNPGVSGSLAYEVFLNSDFAIGGEVGYLLNFTRVSDHYLTQIPVSFKTSYLPVQTGSFDLVLNANAGYDYIKVPDATGEQKSCSALFASLTAQPTYYFGDSWGVGLEGGVMGLLELHSKTKVSSDAFMLSFPVYLVVSYRH